MWILGLKGLMQTCIDWIMAPIKINDGHIFVNSVEILKRSHYMKIFCTVSLGDGAICNTQKTYNSSKLFLYL